MSYSVKITGFNTKEEAVEFCNWYEGQGEQDSTIWFECRKDEGEIPSRSMMTESIDSNDDEVLMKLRMR